MDINKGDIVIVRLDGSIRSVQGGTRPCVVIQNNVGNRHSTTTIVAPLTSKVNKTPLPTHVKIPSGQAGLSMDSLVLAEQIRTIDKCDVQFIIGKLSGYFQALVDRAVRISLAL